jgi:branched-chain amino acid transport system ATP-binding protein
MTALAVDRLSKSFNGFHALKDVSLKVAAGERRAVIGPNGAGKSTLFNVIGGQALATEGHVALRGADISKELPHQRWSRGLARTFQRNQLFAGLTVRENISLAVYRSLNIGSRLLSRADRGSQVQDAIDAGLARVGLLDRQNAAGGDLAYGEQRQLELALALVGKPAILLLDEPTAGMSPAETEAMLGVLTGLSRDITLLIVEHDMDVVFALADRVTVLHLGEVLMEGTPREIQADRRVASVYLGQELGEAV